MTPKPKVIIALLLISSLINIAQWALSRFGYYRGWHVHLPGWIFGLIIIAVACREIRKIT